MKMKQKTKGAVILICGIICIVSAIIIFAMRLVFGEEIVDNIDFISIFLWLALGAYFCRLGTKMRKKEN